MAVKIYSLTKQGGIKLSAHFTAREFACKNGSDQIKIDTKLVQLLEQIRTWAGAPVSITSAYRTPTYNAKVGGAKSSQHVLGKAADIVVKGKSPSDVARFAQAIGATGIGLYTASKFVHIDVRASRYFWRNSGSGNVTVNTHGGACPYLDPGSTLRRGSTGTGVRWLQWWMALWGYNIKVDGKFGAKTEDAVKNLQKRLKLSVDGIVGAKTRSALRGELAA